MNFLGVIVEQAYPDDATIAASLQHDSPLAELNDDVRLGRELLKATRPFSVESVTMSWWHMSSSIALMVAALAGAGLLDWWPLRVGLSLLGALLMVRAFITYHDFMHGAILRDSRLASILFQIYGALTLVPARSWKKSHNHHHGHVGLVSHDGARDQRGRCLEHTRRQRQCGRR